MSNKTEFARYLLPNKPVSYKNCPCGDRIDWGITYQRSLNQGEAE